MKSCSFQPPIHAANDHSDGKGRREVKAERERKGREVGILLG